jgi:hypothetical protein
MSRDSSLGIPTGYLNGRGSNPGRVKIFLFTKDYFFNSNIRGEYTSPNIIRMIKSRRMRWAGHLARMGAKRNACRILVGKRPLGRPRRRSVDNIKIDLRELGWDGMDWIDLAQDRDRDEGALLNTVMNLRVP